MKTLTVNFNEEKEVIPVSDDDFAIFITLEEIKKMMIEGKINTYEDIESIQYEMYEMLTRDVVE